VPGAIDLETFRARRKVFFRSRLRPGEFCKCLRVRVGPAEGAVLLEVVHCFNLFLHVLRLLDALADLLLVLQARFGHEGFVEARPKVVITKRIFSTQVQKLSIDSDHLVTK